MIVWKMETCGVAVAWLVSNKLQSIEKVRCQKSTKKKVVQNAMKDT
jgi:hypothetical protein